MAHHLYVASDMREWLRRGLATWQGEAVQGAAVTFVHTSSPLDSPEAYACTFYCVMI